MALGAFAAIAFNALLANTAWRPIVGVTIIGLTLEVLGILLLALDFWWPLVLRGLDWLTRWGIRTRLNELPSRVVAVFTRRPVWARVSARATMPFETVAGGFPPTEGYEDVRSFDEVNRRLRDLVQRLSSHEAESAAKHERLRRVISELDRTLRADVQESIRRSKDQYLLFRIAGLFIALAGTVVLGVGNLLTS